MAQPREGELVIAVRPKERRDSGRRWRYLKPFPATDAGHKQMLLMLQHVGWHKGLSAFWFHRWKEAPMGRIVVGLVGDHHRQARRKCAAQDLFRAPLVQLSQRYAEEHCDDWAFLSAKHGVLFPGKVVKPYEQSLGKVSARRLAKWVTLVDAQLGEIWPDAEFVVLGSRRHARGVRRYVHGMPWGHVSPHQCRKWLTSVLDGTPV